MKRVYLKEYQMEKNKTLEDVKLEIINRFKPLNPYKVILFSSYAYGTSNKDSDIDLYVVTNDDFIPKTWREKANIALKYSRKIRDLQKIIPIDLIVHTKVMYEKFKKLNSSFYRDNISKGKLLC